MKALLIALPLVFAAGTAGAQTTPAARQYSNEEIVERAKDVLTTTMLAYPNHDELVAAILTEVA